LVSRSKTYIQPRETCNRLLASRILKTITYVFSGQLSNVSEVYWLLCTVLKSKAT